MNDESITRNKLFQAVISRLIVVFVLSLFLGYAGYASDQSDLDIYQKIQGYSEQELKAFLFAKNGQPLSYSQSVIIVFVVSSFFISIVETFAFFLRRIWQRSLLS